MMTTNFDRPLTVGIYHTTESFKSAPAHVAVMFEEDSTLVAVTGYADDPDNVQESDDYAKLFAAAPKMRKALSDALEIIARSKRIIQGQSSIPHVIEGDLESLYWKIDELLDSTKPGEMGKPS